MFVYSQIVRSCEALRLLFQPLAWKKGGVVKPHGRLGWVSSEVITDFPLPTYRRGGLPRPFRGLKVPGRVHLGDSFPLRCIQRLSVPTIATRRCHWRDSRDTSGSSDSVLSY